MYFLACNCDTNGTDDISCSSNGICNCNEGYDGVKCNLCATGYFQNVNGICQGIFKIPFYIMYISDHLFT